MMTTIPYATATISGYRGDHGNTPNWGNIPIVRILPPGPPPRPTAPVTTTTGGPEFYRWRGQFVPTTTFTIPRPTLEPQPANYPTSSGAKPWSEYVSSLDNVVTKELNKAYSELGSIDFAAGKLFTIDGVTPYVPEGYTTAYIAGIMFETLPTGSGATAAPEKTGSNIESTSGAVPEETSSIIEPTSGTSPNIKGMGGMAVAGLMVVSTLLSMVM